MLNEQEQEKVQEEIDNIKQALSCLSDANDIFCEYRHKGKSTAENETIYNFCIDYIVMANGECKSALHTLESKLCA